MNEYAALWFGHDAVFLIVSNYEKGHLYSAGNFCGNKCDVVFYGRDGSYHYMFRYYRTEYDGL